VGCVQVRDLSDLHHEGLACSTPFHKVQMD
jgi:hypothetical protein